MHPSDIRLVGDRVLLSFPSTLVKWGKGGSSYLGFLILLTDYIGQLTRGRESSVALIDLRNPPLFCANTSRLLRDENRSFLLPIYVPFKFVLSMSCAALEHN